MVRGRRELAPAPLAPGTDIDTEAARVLAAVLPVVAGLATRHRLPERIRRHRPRMPFQGGRVVLRLRGLRHDRCQQLARLFDSGRSDRFTEIARGHHRPDERPHPRTGQVHAILDEEFRASVRQRMPIDQHRVRILRDQRRQQAVVGSHPTPRDAGVHHEDTLPVAEHVEHGAQLSLGDVAVGSEVDQHLRLQIPCGADALEYLEDVRRLPSDGGIHRGAVDAALEGAARAERDGIPDHRKLAGIPTHQRWRWPGRARDARHIHGSRDLGGRSHRRSGHAGGRCSTRRRRRNAERLGRPRDRPLRRGEDEHRHAAERGEDTARELWAWRGTVEPATEDRRLDETIGDGRQCEGQHDAQRQRLGMAEVEVDARSCQHEHRPMPKIDAVRSLADPLEGLHIEQPAGPSRHHAGDDERDGR